MMSLELVGMVQIAAFAVAYWLRGMTGVLIALGACLPLSASAAIYIGWIGVPVPTMAIVLTAGFAIVIDPGRVRVITNILRPRAPVVIFTILTAYAVFSAVFFPRLLDGVTRVYTLDRSVEGVGSTVSRLPLVPLSPGGGNLTQSVYFLSSLLTLALLSAVLTGSRERSGVPLFGAAAFTFLFFGALDVFDGIGPVGTILEYVRNADYRILSEHKIFGFDRIIGASAEASTFGAVGVILFAYFAFRFTETRETVDLGLTVAILCFIVLSLSSTAYVGVVFILTLLVLSQGLAISRYLNPLAAVAVSLLALIALLAVGALWVSGFGATIEAIVDNLVFSKLETSSGLERGEWAMQSFRNFLETGGIGVGLGSSRPNGWPFAVLGQLGLLGAALWIAFLATTVFRPLPRGRSAEDARTRAIIRPARAAAIAVLFAATLSSPLVDLGYFFMTAAAIMTTARASVPDPGAAPVRSGFRSAGTSAGPPVRGGLPR
jgi:hypothetical protein